MIDFKSMLETESKPILKDEFIQVICTRIDANKDGIVDVEEILGFFARSI
jgi:hypothetical protein